MILEKYSLKWTNISERVKIVPGKSVLTKLNEYLQSKYKISITPHQIIKNMEISDIDISIKDIIAYLGNFKNSSE